MPTSDMGCPFDRAALTGAPAPEMERPVHASDPSVAYLTLQASAGHHIVVATAVFTAVLSVSRTRGITAASE